MTDFNRFDDTDPQETEEWLESIESVLKLQGTKRAHFLLERMIDYARRSGAYLPYSPSTAYLNTISVAQQPEYPGNRAIERRIEAYIRWNAMAMVVQANRRSSEYGGHIASYASSATLYEVGFNHFWRAASSDHGGDLIYMQGHSSPGIYARAYLEGRLSEQELSHFRREIKGPGLSSYPHPWLMPDFWQFPTVSMGLGAMMAIFQARFMRYLQHRDIIDTAGRKVWCFLGDGEMDEPESMGAITMPVLEKLDNLVFVINCNLQRLDGPVRGNGKIIQELEAAFGGAGWNVIKVVWGSRWDPLLERDHKGLLRRVMEECVDGDYQNFKAMDGTYVREHFFGRYSELKEMVANMSDEEIWHLNRGGLDSIKVFAAYDRAVRHEGRPTVILAKTIKGFGMGESGEGKMTAHQAKKLDRDDLKEFRDRFNIPVSDSEIDDVPYCKPLDGSQELQYLHERRQQLGGYLPARNSEAEPLEIPKLETLQQQLDGSDGREISTTMVFVRILAKLVRDKNIGKNIVPIIPDEARTFGMEGMFRQIGIYSSVGQLYTPQDAETLMYYREDRKGQILEEGINEVGAFCSWIAAGTSYSSHGVQMIPFYIFYSMFGFQRIGDFIWAAGDMQVRGFLIGGTAGRTTLAGEGLQHQDGQSHILAPNIPNCVAYDPAYAYELAVIIHSGMHRMYREQENVFYYITCMNENYAHPAIPEGAEEGILKGMYRVRSADGSGPCVQLFGSGSILREALAAAETLEQQFNVMADVWSVTSYSELRRDGIDCDRWNRRHPAAADRAPYVSNCLKGVDGPFIAVSDYMRIVPDQIRQWVPGRFVVLGTDGFGRSDSRAALREFFEIDSSNIVLAALNALADDGKLDCEKVQAAVAALGLDPDKSNPVNV